MKYTKRGMTFKFPFFRNVGFAFKQSYNCAPVEFVLFFVFQVLLNASSALSPLLLTTIVGYIESGTVALNLTMFFVCIAGYVVIELIGFVESIISNRYFQYTISLKLDPYNTKKVFQKLTKIKYGYFYSKDFADNYQLVYAAAVNGCVVYVPWHFAGILGGLIGATIAVATLGYLSVWAMLIAIFPAVGMFVLNYRNAAKDFEFGKEEQKIERQEIRYSKLLQNGRSLREMKSNKSDDYVFDEWEKVKRAKQKISFKRTISWMWVDIFCAVLESVALVGSVAFCVIMLRRGQMTIAVFTGIFSATPAVFAQMSVLASSLGSIRKALLYTDSYRTFIESDDEEKGNANVEPEKFESIEFRNVSFIYPEYAFQEDSTNIIEKTNENAKKALDDVSFTLKRGERVAIVGENGSGKTTITKLIAKLYNPTSGEILFNGKPLNQVNLAGYRDNFSVINQEFAHYEFPLDVAVGISLDKEVSERIIKNNLKKAGAEDVLAQADAHQGFSTWLTREFDGMELSGGQKQKVAIARGFLKKAEVLMVDEPTSALDPLVEEKILSNILKATEGRTAIVISHRLSLCTKMDRILYMENGKIVEDGSHEELMKKRGGKYRKLFNTQSKWYSGGEI